MMMLRMILVQLWNKRGNNAWLFTELLLVFCLLWYIMDYMFVLGWNYSQPSHRDLDQTWQVFVRQLPEDHAEYQVSQADSTAVEANFFRVMEHIRQAEGVEAVAVMNDYSTPGGGSYYGTNYRSLSDTTRRCDVQLLSFDPRWDFFRVFRYTDADGKEVSTADFDLLSPNTTVISPGMANQLFPDGPVVGREIGQTYVGAPEPCRIVGVVGDIKRFDYLRIQPAVYSMIRVDGSNCMSMEIAIRSSDRIPDAIFQERFMERMSRELRIGNFYLKSLKSYNKIDMDTGRKFGQTGEVRTYTGMMLFFLVNIMLCVMGTFWYRVSQRRGEIGLRMAMGSTRSGIRRMLFLEGICLLTIVAVVATLIDSQIVYAGFLNTLGKVENPSECFPDRMLPRFLITTAFTWIVLSVAILLAIWIPVNRASNLEPAESLRYE